MKAIAAIVGVLMLGVASCRLPPAGHRTVRGAIGPEGGLLATTWGVALSVPPGALQSVVIISIGDALNVPAGAVRAVELGPSGTQFQIPATLYITVPDDETFPGHLKIMTPSDAPWTAMPGYAGDPTTREVSALLMHLSPYGLVASNEDCRNGIDDDGDGTSDCEDPLCAADVACSSADGGMAPDAGPVDGDAGATDVDGGTDDGGVTALICHNDNQCSSGMVCVNLECVMPVVDADGGVVATTCHNDNQCSSGMVCVNLECVMPAIDADGGVVTTTCHNDNQCPAGFVCISNECTQAPADAGDGRCTADADCAAGLVCRGHQCR